VTKSSELFSIIKEKILEEVFDLGGGCQNTETFLKNKECEENHLVDDEFKKNLSRELIEIKISRNNSTGNMDIELERKQSTASLTNFRRKSKKDIEENKVIIEENNKKMELKNNTEKDILKPTAVNKSVLNAKNKYPESSNLKNFKNLKNNIPPTGTSDNTSKNIPNSNIKNPNNTTFINKNNFSPFNSNQVKFLFKGFFGDDDNENFNFQEEISTGQFHQNFYNNVYNKYNGLPESFACKRKNVCLKLLQILELIVKIFI
jgi:hypothetical protein